MAINGFVLIRIVIGALFMASGFEKLIGPYQNFLYVVQSYEFLGKALEGLTAHVVPWAEFFLGAFLAFGLWTKWVLRALQVFTAVFILVVAQALVRGLSITECGCFGNFLSVPLPVILLFDTALFVVISLLIRKEERANVFSLDRYFVK